MRALIATGAALAGAIALIAGCGGGGEGTSDDPLAAALAYLPADTPFAATFETDLDGEQFTNLSSLAEENGGGDIRGLLALGLESATGGELSFEEDFEPLLGNPVVISATDISTFSDDSVDDFVAAFQVSDSEALDNLLETAGVEEQGEEAGATIYADGLAVDDDMVVFAGTDQFLSDALARADGDDGLDADTFEASFEGLPESPLVGAYFNVEQLIDNDPDAEQARSVPWVAALTTFGMALTIGEDSIAADFNLRSDGEELSEEELPLAPGAEAPSVLTDPGRIGVGLSDPSHVVRFFEDTLALIEPDDFEAFEAAKPAIADQFGIDLDADVIDQLTGDLSLSIGLDGSFDANAELADPEAFSETLDGLVGALPQLGPEIGIGKVTRRGDGYFGRLADDTLIAFGLIDDALFVARGEGDGPGGESATVEGATGSLVASADAEDLLNQALAAVGAQIDLPVQIPPDAFERLGELTASVETSTEGMRGRISLSLVG